MERHQGIEHAGAAAVYFFLIVTALFSVVYWVLMPAWPLGVTYTKGLLGIDQRNIVTESLKQAALERGVWTKRIEAESFKDIQADPRLMDMVRQTGRTLFGDNCAACHGSNAQGGKGFPNLTTASWLWGGDPESIAETIRVGINSAHPQTRTSQMMAFGRDQMLKKDEVDNVVSLRAQPFRSRCRKGCACRENRCRQGRLHRQLRPLPWRRCQGKSRSRRRRT